MRRKLLSVLFTLCLASLIAGLVACGDGNRQDQANQTDKVLQGNCVHQWDEGVITTYPTCMTPGVITYTCADCEATKKEILDADGESHVFVGYEYDETYHWHECRLCGETVKQEHDFEVSPEGRICKECGYLDSTSNYAYQVNFVCGDGVSVLVYETQDYSAGGAVSTLAYSRSKTGELLKDGEGQVNFEIVAALGYKITGLTAEPATGYKNFKGEEETERENTYRITKITSDLTVYIETEIDTLDLPVMIINTENAAPILDKENYVTCSVSVLNAEEEYCFSEVSAGIRGRGNSTWEMPKKPYRLKFDKKIDLFGNGSAKSWTLIANYCDPSLIRNYLAYTIGSEFEAIRDTTTTVRFVEVYLNGSYDGVYLICEQNEVGETRVDIEDDFAKAANPEEMGYLLELDYRASSEGEENLDYITVNGAFYAIKSPDYGDIENDAYDFTVYVEYIKNYLELTVTALNSKDYGQVTRYIDVYSFADSYILNELFNNKDVGQTSFFIYKKQNGLLYSGPIWDYDVSSGNCNFNDTSYQEKNSSEYDCLWAKELNVWYNCLLEFEEFRSLVAQKLKGYETVVRQQIDECIQNVFSSRASFLRNFDRWDILGTDVWPNTEEIIAITTWEGQVEYVREWLLNSLAYMLSVYCPNEESSSVNIRA